jgi:hypothetical protein
MPLRIRWRWQAISRKFLSSLIAGPEIDIPKLSDFLPCAVGTAASRPHAFYSEGNGLLGQRPLPWVSTFRSECMGTLV